jgi:serine/threonine protein kinase/Tfp pilus assembly protein PilF
MDEKQNNDRTKSHISIGPETPVAQYRIISQIGAGGMGEVYLAHDQKLERDVALKFLPSHVASDADLRTRFTREARAAARLSHPNIVTVFEVGEFNGRPYFAMEHVRGKPLNRHADDKTLTFPEIINLAIQICEGLAEAHSAGVIHRDIKASNIVVDEKGRPRLLDFGLAAVQGEKKVTRSGSTIGTVAYMSPEQIAGREIDARSDIFSLGVVIYELVAGRTPFRRDSEAATMSAVIHDDPEPMARYKSGVSDELERIVAKALRKDVKSRYQSVADMLADLRHLAVPAGTGTGAPDRKMIAVLPFENLGSAEDEYFADGITEEITSRLAVVRKLGVISRTSALRYKNAEKSIAEIGHELGVDYVLEGTVRWAKASEGPNRVRITPQLIHVADDTHLWAERYDREIDDIFEVQSDIAEKVITQLNITLLDSEHEVIRAKPTENVRSYDYYLKGRESFDRPDYAKEDFEEAIGYFERALEVEPEFALALVYLGRAHSMLYFFGHDMTEPRIDKARDYIERALEINENLGEAHLALGELHYHHKRDLDRALEEVERAEDTVPLEANDLRTAIYRRRGLVSDAVQLALKSTESSPGDPRIALEMGVTFALMQEHDRAEEWIERAIALAPQSLNAWTHRAMLEVARGDPSAARRQFDRMPADIDAREQTEQLFVDLYLRDYKHALEFLSNFPAEVEYYHFGINVKAQLYGLVYHLMNKPAEARDYLLEARAFLEPLVEAQSEDPRPYIELSTTLALLEQFEPAIEYATAALKMMPIYRDALIVPFYEYRAAQVMTVAGRHDDALDIIERVVGRRLFQTLPMFTFSPMFDALADHPRMKALRDKYSYQYPAQS